MSRRIKFVVAGPRESGKSSIVNFLCDTNKNQPGLKDSIYFPTTGCRILELLVDDTVVEIWDVGGDHKSAQSMMPAFSQPCESRNGKRTCDGYLLVYSPDRLEDREELLNWYKSFADLSSNWQDKECAVFAVGRKNKDVVELKLTEPLPQCTHHNITLENGSEIRGYFRTFITTIQNTACS